jgi:signal transduction histidine kinase
LANAISHGQNDAPVSVTAKYDTGRLLMSVRNLGEPIPVGVMARMFEPYYRPASSAPGGGLGLGLYICKQIADAHGGTLTVTSNDKDGTTFTACIPTKR